MTEFELTIDIDGRPLNVFVQYKGRAWQEMFGADADGNRGVMQTDCEIEQVIVLDMRRNDITDKLEKRHAIEVEKIWELVDEKLCDDYWRE